MSAVKELFKSVLRNRSGSGPIRILTHTRVKFCLRSRLAEFAGTHQLAPNMFWKHSVPAALLAVLVLLPTPGSAADGLAAFQARAARFHTVVSIPEFETTPEAVKATADKTIAAGNAALDSLGQLHPSEVNFHNTIRALDDVNYLLQVPPTGCP